MDQEMNFPNPVVRTDLPTRRSRWPRVLLGGAVLGLLVVLFLPQIMSSKVGRRIVVGNIAGKTNSKVTLESFSTSWFGGTSLHFLSITDAAGRRIAAKSVTTQASLWALLRGRYRLGTCVIDGLTFEYVLDDGRGGDTFDYMKPPAPPTPPSAGNVAPPAPSTAQRLVPNLSGKITINGGTVVLHRGTVQPKLYNTTWQQGRLENVEATFDIESLDRPWTYTFSADSVEGDKPRGTIHSSGTVDLGEGRPFDVKDLSVDCKLTGENVYTGGLGAALIPESLPEDVRQALGPVLTKLDVVVKGEDGRFKFERLDASGPISNVRLKPTIDLTATPAVVEVTSAADSAGGGSAGGPPGVIQVGVSKRVANGGLVYLNPFFREAAGGQGGVTIHVRELRVPLAWKGWAKGLEAKGRMWAQAVLLNREDEMNSTDPLPDNLASQLAMLTGDDQRNVLLDVDGPFAISRGVVTHGPTTTTVGDTTLMIEGTTELDGDALKASAALVRSPSITSLVKAGPSQKVRIPLGGTIRKPQLGVSQMSGVSGEAATAVKERIAAQTLQMRAKETQRSMEKSSKQVEDILRPLQPPPGTPAPGSGK